MEYDDGLIALDDEGIVIRRYYPWWGAKKIPYGSIRSIATFDIQGVTSGKWRIWGSGDFKHWWNLDGKRPSKEKAIEIHTGGHWVPTISPVDADSVERILAQKIGGR